MVERGYGSEGVTLVFSLFGCSVRFDKTQKSTPEGVCMFFRSRLCFGYHNVEYVKLEKDRGKKEEKMDGWRGCWIGSGFLAPRLIKTFSFKRMRKRQVEGLFF